MKLVVGLGNPGEKYRKTFHNVGFLALDLLAEELKETNWLNRFKGELIRGSIGDHSYSLLKPMTFMNLSGESVSACRQFYKLELEDIIVVSDDIDRPLGSLTYRTSGGHGGHNGLRSIIEQCGGNTFHRIKIGIGRPDPRQDVSSYVLSKPDSEELNLLESAVKDATSYLFDFIKDKKIHIQSQSSLSG